MVVDKAKVSFFLVLRDCAEAYLTDLKLKQQPPCTLLGTFNDGCVLKVGHTSARAGNIYVQELTGMTSPAAGRMTGAWKFQK